MRSATKSRGLVAALALLTLVSACTSSGQNATTSSTSASANSASTTAKGSTATTGSNAGSAAPGSPNPSGSGGTAGAVTATAQPAVLFTSTDGSAFAGSRPVFTLTNTATGKTVAAPVVGAGATTQSTVYVDPGTYTVTAADRYVGPTGSYAVKNISPAQITVAAAAVDAAPAATVSFGLDVAQSPFDLTLDNVTASQVDLSWQALGNAQVSGYQLRETLGSTPAASPTDGAAIDIDAGATKAVAQSLSPDSQYTFTLFATGSDGAQLAFRSVSVTTPKTDGSTPSYALAPNTIVPTDFAALKATALGNSRVSVTLTADNADRSSTTAIPGVDTSTLTSGCVPGMPFLVSSDVAGDQAFFGVIESCGTKPPSLRAATEPSPYTAIVDTDQPLAAVVPYLHFDNTAYNACMDASSGDELAADDPLCAGTDTDGDGMKDTTEQALGRNPNDPADGWNAWLAEGKKVAVAAAGNQTSVTDLQPPAGLGTGDVQVTLLWSTADDIDLAVTDPSGERIDYNNPTSASGGALDADDKGEDACPAASKARAENVVWKSAAPDGTYTVNVSNYRASNGGAACGPTVQARLEIKVGGKLQKMRVLTVGVDGPITFTVSHQAPYNQARTIGDLALRSSVPTGDLQVSVLWNTGDDVNLAVTDPAGNKVTPDQSPSATGGSYYLNQAGRCRAGGGTLQDVVVWGADALSADDRGKVAVTVLPGVYSVQATTVYPNTLCGSASRLEGWVEVRLHGTLIARDFLVLPNPKNLNPAQQTSQSPVITFTIPPSAPGLRAAGGAFVANPAAAHPAASHPARAAAAPKLVSKSKIPITCSGVFSNRFEANLGFEPFRSVHFTLKGGSVVWDAEAGIRVSADPAVVIEGGVSCSADLPSVTFQLTQYPIPINLELTPIVEGSATGKFELKGPKLELSIGVNSSGSVDASVEKCGRWFLKIPCGINVTSHSTTKPFAGFTHGAVTVKAEGQLSVGLGVEVSIGVGVKNTFVTAKAGFAIKMRPIVAQFTASASFNTAPTSSAPPRTTPAPTTTAPSTPATSTRSDGAITAKTRDQLSAELDAIYLQQARTASVHDYGSGPRKVVGPVDSQGECLIDTHPLPVLLTSSSTSVEVYECTDAVCVDAVQPYIAYAVFPSAYLYSDVCRTALCAATRTTIPTNDRNATDRIACAQAPLPPGVATPVVVTTTSPTTTSPTATTSPSGSTSHGSTCLKIGLLADMSVDFRAETWVLAWGKDRRYPLWNGSVDYPFATWKTEGCK